MEHRPIESIRREIRILGRELARAVVFDEALGLAIEERTGKEPEDGAEYTAADVERAEEIMVFFPEGDV